MSQDKPTKLTRRGFLKATGGVGAAMFLAACAPMAAPTGGGSAPAQDRSLRFWMWNTFAPAADDVMNEALVKWAAENNVNIEISRDSDSAIGQKVFPALEAGTLPDALFVGAADALQLIEANGTASVKDLFEEIGAAHGGWLPRLEGYVTRNGDIQFLPYSIDTPMVHIRQDVIEAAGLTMPEGQWTWDETRDIALAAQEYTAQQGRKMVGWGFGVVRQQHDGWCEDLFRNFGADLWDESGTRIILAEEKMAEAIEAINFAKEAWDMGLFPDDAAAWDWSTNNKSYQEDQSILVINAASIYVWAQNNKPELAEATHLAPKPKAVRDTTNAGLRYTLVQNREARNPTVARELIKALYDSSIYAPWLENGFVTNVLHEYDALPMWTGKRAQFNLAANIGVYGGYPAPYDNAAMAEANSTIFPIGTIMVRVLLDGWTPERAIEEADTQLKDVFAKYF